MKVFPLFCVPLGGATPQHRNTATPQHRNTATPQHRNTARLMAYGFSFCCYLLNSASAK
jgi:hypothetical protein